MRLRPYRLWILAFVGFFLMIGAWAVAAPYDATADEHDHIYRAAGVIAGDVAPEPTVAVRGSGAFQHVPAGLVRPWPADSTGGRPSWGVEQPCWSWHLIKSAACAQPPSADREAVLVGSGAGRYNPVYYAIVGVPLQWWPGWPGVLLARLIGGALSAALLAGALVAVVRYSRRGLMMAGLLVATTPMTMHFTSAVNPNGLEIAAGVAFFAATIPLLLGRRLPERPKGLLWLAGTSALGLATLRPTGLLYLAFAAVALLLPLGASNLRALWRVRAARWWTAGVAAASALAVAWVVVMKATEPGTIFTFGRRYTGGQAIFGVFNRWGDYLEQAIGVFNWGETRLPPPVYLLWEFAGGALLVLAAVVGHRLDRWRLFGLLAGGVLVPSAIQVYYVNSVGYVTQGRYMLPMLAGVMLLAANVIEERDGLSAAHGRALTRSFVLLLLPLQFFALVLAMVRWQRGLPNAFGIGWLNPFVGQWHPVVGSWTPLVALTCGLVIYGWLAWRAAAAPAGLAQEDATAVDHRADRGEPGPNGARATALAPPVVSGPHVSGASSSPPLDRGPGRSPGALSPPSRPDQQPDRDGRADEQQPSPYG